MDVIVAEAVVGRAPTLSFSTTLTLDLNAEQRTRILAQGISLTRTIPFEPKLHQLRIVALDISSGAVGSVLPHIRRGVEAGDSILIRAQRDVSTANSQLPTAKGRSADWL